MKIIPHEIKAPGLSSANYGENINEQFNNINDNFKALGNYDFIKGKQGDSIYIKNITLVKPEQLEYSESLSLGEQLYMALYESVLKWANDALFEDDMIYADPLESIIGPKIFNWDDSIIESNYEVPIIVSQDSISKSETYLCSAGSSMFFDNRFSAAAIKEYQYKGKYKENMIDTTCIINFSFNNDKNKWECYINTSFPRLKFNDNAFYWVLNDHDSNIKATGLKGDRGYPAQVWIGKCDRFPSIADDTQLNISHLLTDNGWEKVEDIGVPENMRIGDVIIVYCFDSDKNYQGFFVTNINNINIYYKSIIIIYKSENHVNFINYIHNTKEFFKTIGYTTKNEDNAAKGIFILVDPNGESAKYDNYMAHMMYNKLNKLYISPVREYDNPESNLIPEQFDLTVNYKVTVDSDLNNVGDVIGLNVVDNVEFDKDLLVKQNVNIGTDDNPSALNLIGDANIGTVTNPSALNLIGDANIQNNEPKIKLNNPTVMGSTNSCGSIEFSPHDNEYSLKIENTVEQIENSNSNYESKLIVYGPKIGSGNNNPSYDKFTTHIMGDVIIGERKNSFDIDIPDDLPSGSGNDDYEDVGGGGTITPGVGDGPSIMTLSLDDETSSTDSPTITGVDDFLNKPEGEDDLLGDNDSVMGDIMNGSTGSNSSTGTIINYNKYKNTKGSLTVNGGIKSVGYSGFDIIGEANEDNKILAAGGVGLEVIGGRGGSIKEGFASSKPSAYGYKGNALKVDGNSYFDGDVKVKGRYLSDIPGIRVNIDNAKNEVGSSTENPYVIETGALYLNTGGQDITVSTEFHMAAARGAIIDIAINIYTDGKHTLTLFINGLDIIKYTGRDNKGQLRVMILGTKDDQGNTDVISVSGTHNIDKETNPFYNLKYN